MICDSRFESQIAIAIKSRDLENLGGGFSSPEMAHPDFTRALNVQAKTLKISAAATADRPIGFSREELSRRPSDAESFV